MVTVRVKTLKGKRYLYLEKSIRIRDQARKISRYLGAEKKLSNNVIEKSKKLFEEELLRREVSLRVNQIMKRITNPEYPLTKEEIQKIEEMNVKHKKIITTLHEKNVEDLNKRFIANYVFESNALEGNSLTLRNVAEIIFENRVMGSQDLREVYDAQNSYKVFLWLQRVRSKMDHKLIMKIHSRLMERIDDRLGYRNVPMTILGNPLAKLSKAEDIEKDMNDLLRWYNKNKDAKHPLELAFKFHARFEKIHPFCDGNGRTGRFLLSYILMQEGYFPIIIRRTTRNRYLKALQAADRERWGVLMRFALKHYKETFRKFYEVYYKYAV